MARRSQRSIITPEHFIVAPEILGLPLASPSRRALAMGIDLLLVVILVKSGAVFLAFVAALLLFRASSSRKSSGGFIRASVRNSLRIIGAIVLFVGMLKLWGAFKQRAEPPSQRRRDEAAQLMVDRSTAADAQARDPLATDSIFGRYMAAVSRKDSAAARVYRDSVRQTLAGNDLANLEKRAERADATADSLARELVKARKARGIRSFLSGIADDVGVGFGWSAVYFTAFLTLWRGQTPGKRLLGVRVMLLDGKPLGWWMSFERFGGYAASLSVGLMGFLQILWDRNRQGLHDKACETVVVRVTRAATPVQPARRF